MLTHTLTCANVHTRTHTHTHTHTHTCTHTLFSLKHAQGIFVAVNHDRYFLDNIVAG